MAILRIRKPRSKSTREAKAYTVCTTVPVFSKRASGWVGWKLVGKALHEERDKGSQEPNMQRAREAARKRQLELEAEDAKKVKISVHEATKAECHPQCAARGLSEDWSPRL